MLAAPALRRELARCHAFLLPFRVTISEVPLVVIESCLSGRPTIVLDAPGVGEIARRLGGIVAPRPGGLADALLAAATRKPTTAPAPITTVASARLVAVMRRTITGATPGDTKMSQAQSVRQSLLNGFLWIHPRKAGTDPPKPEEREPSTLYVRIGMLYFRP